MSQGDKLSNGNEPPFVANMEQPFRRVVAGLIIAVFLLLGVLWAYWPTFQKMVVRWSDDPQYSHGFLVPIFAMVILWARSEHIPKRLDKPSWLGFLLIVASIVLRFVSAYFFQEPLDGISLIPALLGIVLLLGGWPLFRWTWPAILFLGFMLPLPYSLEMAMAYPLRRLATVVSTYGLQTFGYPAICEGNIILIGDIQLGVIDACSGLGMLFTFFALATAVAIIVDRPMLDRLVLVASAIPIAVAVNIIRITLTGIAHIVMGREFGHALMHDFGGWLMMPMALAMIWFELWFLGRLFSVNDTNPVALSWQQDHRAPLPSRLSKQSD